MAAVFDMRFDVGPITDAVERLQGRAPFAIARALTRTAEGEQVALARDIADDIGVPVRRAKAAMGVQKAWANANGSSNLIAKVVVTGARIKLIDLQARGPEPSRGMGRGVSYSLGGERRRIPTAFIATMRSGHRGVFRRVGALGKVGRKRAMGPSASSRRSAGAWSNNLPIAELSGPSFVRVFEKVVPRGAARRDAALHRNLSHELAYELSRLTA